MVRQTRIALFIVTVLLAARSPSARADDRVAIENDPNAGACKISIDGQEALVYQYGPRWAIPHVHPLRSPSGKSLLLQRAEPPHQFPHHRALWVVDHVQLAGHDSVDFYHCWKNLRNTNEPAEGHRHFIRHQRFTEQATGEQSAEVGADLQWVIEGDTPVLDEHRHMKISDLGNGEYLLDYSWELTAAHGDVKFISDWVHYAWPYVRMHPQFSGEQGGTITNDRGEAGQEATNGKFAKWVDYSNTVDGATEGLAVFVYPDGKPHKWLTREYGTFGPRRPEEYSGTKFTLKRESRCPGELASWSTVATYHKAGWPSDTRSM